MVVFAGGTPPAMLERVDWRNDRELSDLVGQLKPAVASIPEALVSDWQPAEQIAAVAVATLGRETRR